MGLLLKLAERVAPFLKYAKWIGIGLLVAGLAVQTVRVYRAEITIAKQAQAAAEFRADIADARAKGIAAGVAQQKAAQDELDRRQQEIRSGLQADNAKLRESNAAKDARIRALTSGDQWKCLRDPLPEDALKEYRR